MHIKTSHIIRQERIKHNDRKDKDFIKYLKVAEPALTSGF